MQTAGSRSRLRVGCDDFCTSFSVFGAGTTTPAALRFSSLRFGVSPIVNVTAAVVLALTIGAVVLAYVVLRRSGGRPTGVLPLR